MQDARRSMKNQPKSMTAKITNNLEPLTLGIGLNNMPDVAKGGARLYYFYGHHKGVMGYVD